MTAIFLPRPLGPWGGVKGTKHIRRDFYSVAWVMPQGSDLGALGVPGVKKKFKHGQVAYQIDGTTSRTECKENFHLRVKLVTLG